jgi:hypothetical protein
MRMLWIGGVIAAIVLSDASRAPAQWYQQRANATPAAAPDVRGFSIVTSHRSSSPPAEAGRADNQPTGSAPQPTSHDRHHVTGVPSWGVAPWVLWGGGYPMIWSGAFTPGFGVYAPGYSYTNGVAMPQAGDAPRPAPAETTRPEPKPTNADTKARAGKFISYGDALFAKQNYLGASARYRTAAGVAADMAEPSMRQGFALVALGSYESAAKAFRRALAIRPDWSASPFRLQDLYGAGALSKTAHLEGLAAAVEANPFDSELITVLAIELYFDGQRERAELFFVRAAQLGANDDRLLAAFVPRPAPPADPKQAPAPAPAVLNNKGPAKIVF